MSKSVKQEKVKNNIVQKQFIWPRKTKTDLSATDYFNRITYCTNKIQYILRCLLLNLE